MWDKEEVFTFPLLFDVMVRKKMHCGDLEVVSVTL